MDYAAIVNRVIKGHNNKPEVNIIYNGNSPEIHLTGGHWSSRQDVEDHLTEIGIVSFVQNQPDSKIIGVYANAASALGSLGGSSKSSAKQNASRENGKKGGRPSKYVTVNGRRIEFDAAVNLMDDEIREDLHADGITDHQEFIDAYCTRHQEKYGEEFRAD